MKFDKISNVLKYIAGFPRSLYVNFRLLPFSEAIRLPIIVSTQTQLSSLEGKVTLGKVKTGIIRIGFGSVRLVDYSNERTILHIEGHIHFQGKTKIGKASKIEVGKNATLTFGENFLSSAKATIICHKKVTIGKDCIFAWDSLVMDTDYHDILDRTHKRINEDAPISIADKVWLGTRTTILKGATIPKETVVAAGSIVAKNYTQENTILAGNPAKVVKEAIYWR